MNRKRREHGRGASEHDAGPTGYRALDYLGDGRFHSLGHQVRETLKTGADAVVEIGVGPGLFAALLDRLGVRTITVDVDVLLRPRVVGALPRLPLGDRVAPAVVCFQTLEHLPLSQLEPALAEMARVSSRDVIISVPDVTGNALDSLRGLWRAWRTRDRELAFGPRKRHRSGFDGEHYWEIGRGASARHVFAAAARAGLVVDRHFRPPLYGYHHFFCLSKDGKGT